MTDIRKALAPSAIADHVIVIPVKEIEAWLLSDHNAIRKALKLPKAVAKQPNPEVITDPKKHLSRLVSERSGKKLRYVSTFHNSLIAAKADVANLRRCRSFIPFEKFIKDHLRTQ